MQKFFWSSNHKKQQRICIEYTDVSDFMLWLHWGRFLNIKQIKIPSLAAFQVCENNGLMCVRLVLEKNYFLFLWVPIFSCPKAVTSVKNSLY